MSGRQGKQETNGQAGGNGTGPNGNRRQDFFSRFANKTARLSGSPAAFSLAIGAIVLWAATGPLFHFSDTWQLVINTGTTIITFLMVFLIQSTQNRDSEALHLKIDAMILANRKTRNYLLELEDLTQDELDALKQKFLEMGQKDVTADRPGRHPSASHRDEA